MESAVAAACATYRCQSFASNGVQRWMRRRACPRPRRPARSPSPAPREISPSALSEKARGQRGKCGVLFKPTKGAPLLERPPLPSGRLRSDGANHVRGPGAGRHLSRSGLPGLRRRHSDGEPAPPQPDFEADGRPRHATWMSTLTWVGLRTTFLMALPDNVPGKMPASWTGDNDEVERPGFRTLETASRN